MSLNSKILNFVIIAALVFHVLWIVNHFRWVTNGQIDPWKLGGYAMYTVPPPRVTLVLLNLQNPAAPRRIDPGIYSMTRYEAMTTFTNIKRAFRCAHVKAEELKVFFEENPQLRGNNLGFLYLENKFIQNPVATKRVRQGRVTIIWTGSDRFEFTSDFCGNREAGKVALQ
jgi:hypothetical protein